MCVPIAGGVPVLKFGQQTEWYRTVCLYIVIGTCNPIQYFNGQTSENCQLGTKWEPVVHV